MQNNHLDKKFSYIVSREKRKTIGIYVKDGKVLVKAPHFTAQQHIQEWVDTKSPWIEKRLCEQAQEQKEKPNLSNGGNILFLGEQRPIYCREGKPAVTEENNDLMVYHYKNTNIQKLIETWLQQEAQLYINERTNDIAQLMSETTRIKAIQYRKTRSKWGHCTSEGVLQFNWLLIMAPPDVIDYLIIHEVSHLTHMNHSAAFWARVTAFCPTYKTQRNWLKNNGHRLWF